MLDDTENVAGGEATTVTTDEASAPLENVTSSTEDSSVQETTDKDQAVKGQSEFDYLKVLDSLEIDPQVKEALKSGHLRQADYTKKTQELAKERGTLDQYKQVQPVIEFLSKNPDLFNQIYDKMNGVVQPKEGQEQIPDDPKAYADWVKAETIKEFQAIQAKEADYQSAAKVDPRLDSDPEFGEMIAKWVAGDLDFKSGRVSAAQATQKAVKYFDTYMQKQIGVAKTQLSEKAKAKRIGSTITSSPGRTTGGGQPMSIMDAARMAEEELGG